MAITKILYLNEAQNGNPAGHLKNALEYIQNPEKIEERVLVGGINCLPETAFEQMMDTKVTYGKTDKRQGYHIMISFVPGEATEEQVFDIVGRFAREYLKDEYEAVYAVHNDKEHMHGHIVYNSVSFETGAKYDYRKGEWKRNMQPLTNKLCAEYGLEIMPAEYAKAPKNLSRVEWEREQAFRKMILADAEFCQSQATSFDHFVFLMNRIGYQFEYGKYLSIKVPGGKWYHHLDKLDERFAEEKFRFYLDMPFHNPRFVVGNTGAIHNRGTTVFQMKFYRRIYQARMVEQRRFDKHAAYLAKELERMNRLQEQYLFLVKNDIKSVEGLIGYRVKRENEVEKISKRQKALYQESSVRKRACKTEEDVRDYQIWHLGVQEELDALKVEKKELNKSLKLVEACKAEYKSFSRFDYTDIEDVIRHSVEVPEYPHVEKKQVDHYDDYVTDISEAVETLQPDVNTDNKDEVSIDSEEAISANIASVKEVDLTDEIPAAVAEVVADVEVAAPEVVSVEEISLEKDEAEEHSNEWKFDNDSYEAYKRMTPLEKAQSCGFTRLRSYDAVENIVKLKFMDLGYTATADELMEETELLYKGMRELVVKSKVEEVLEALEINGLPFICWTPREKAELLQFQLDDNSYNMQLYNAVCKACGIDTSNMEEVFEDYQAIYDKTVEMQGDKEIGRREGGRGRVR